MGLLYRTADPARVACSSNRPIPSLPDSIPGRMAYALWHNKLWSVHLNDQNGLKYDQDKTFGSVDLRRAFNTVWVLERPATGCIGLDVKADADDQASRSDQASREQQSDVFASGRNCSLRQSARCRRYPRPRLQGLEAFYLSKLMGVRANRNQESGGQESKVRSQESGNVKKWGLAPATRDDSLKGGFQPVPVPFFSQPLQGQAQ